MRRPVLTLSLALALHSTAGQSEPQLPDPASTTVPDRQIGAKASPCLRIRSGPSLDRDALDCLEPGTQVKLQGEIAGWSHVRLLDGREGWVASGFLEPLTPPPAARIEAAAEIQEQIEALEGQLAAARERVTELEDALAESEGRLLRAAGLSAQQERRIEGLDAALAAAREREEEQQQALAEAEGRLRTAEETNAEQARRIEQLEEPPPEPPRRAARRRRLAEARDELRLAQETNAEQARRIEQLEAGPPAAPEHEAELQQELAAAEDRLRAAEQTGTEQAGRIAALTGQLAEAELKLAQAQLQSRLARRPQATEASPSDSGVRVRPPLGLEPEGSKVAVRVPAAMREEQDPPPADPPAEAPRSTTDSAVSVVQAWAAAWSDQRVDDYLSFYGAGFRPASGLERSEWEAQRRQRLSAPGYIRVTISTLGAKRDDEGAVLVTFRQEYESDRFGDTVTKVLTLAEEDGSWRIVSEQTTP